MEKKVLIVVAAALLLFGITSSSLAGFEPTPWEPEINKLHSIELNIAAIQKRLDKLGETEPSPMGATNYLDAMGNQLGVLDTRLGDTLSLLPPYNQLDMQTQGDVFLSLDAIRADASAIGTIFNRITEGMGIEPVPWAPILTSIIGRINGYIGTTY